MRRLLPLLALIGAAPLAWGQTASSLPPVPVHDSAPGSARAATASAAAGAITFSREPLRSADIAVDAQGGLHVAFVSLGRVGLPEHKPTVYGYCPPANLAACADPSGWTLVEVDADWPHVRIALTPEGRPRLFLYDDRATVENTSATIYAFAACDAGCGTAAGWRVRVFGASRDAGNVDSDRRPVRRFTLDAEGRPRFVYYLGTRWLSGTEWEQPGYYLACDADCAGTGAWREVRLPDAYLQGEVHDLENAALAFGPDGKARMLFALQYPYDGNPLDLRDALVYAECPTPCARTEDWSAPRPILWLGIGPEDKSFSARVDPSGRVHVAVKPIDASLQYLWCDGDCTRHESWTWYPLDLPTRDGEHPALALDAQENPRIAYKDARGGLGYAWCDADCRSGNATWYRTLAEDEDLLMGEVPVALPPSCTDHYWFGGMRPSLALDPAGNPRFAYDADYERRCYVNPQRPELGTFIERTWWTSRFAFFAQPGQPSSAPPAVPPAQEVALAAPYPNPVSGAATLGFTLPEGGPVRLAVYDVLGREVTLLLDAALPGGPHASTLHADGLAPGRYVVRLQAGAATATRPVLVVR
jgi:hypothetical protein